MHFAADPNELVRIIRVVCQTVDVDAGGIHLKAQANKVIAKKEGSEAGTIAMVFEEGEYDISNYKLMQIVKALKKHYGRVKKPEPISVVVNERFLRFGSFVLTTSAKDPKTFDEIEILEELNEKKNNRWLDTKWWDESGNRSQKPNQQINIPPKFKNQYKTLNIICSLLVLAGLLLVVTSKFIGMGDHFSLIGSLFIWFGIVFWICNQN